MIKTILLAIHILLFSFASLGVEPHLTMDEVEEPAIKKAVQSAVIIKSSGHSGTGVYLGNGVILTAGHVVIESHMHESGIINMQLEFGNKVADRLFTGEFEYIFPPELFSTAGYPHPDLVFMIARSDKALSVLNQVPAADLSQRPVSGNDDPLFVVGSTRLHARASSSNSYLQIGRLVSLPEDKKWKASEIDQELLQSIFNYTDNSLGAEVEKGDSGGPVFRLVSDTAEVVGVTSLKIKEGFDAFVDLARNSVIKEFLSKTMIQEVRALRLSRHLYPEAALIKATQIPSESSVIPEFSPDQLQIFAANVFRKDMGGRFLLSENEAIKALANINNQTEGLFEATILSDLQAGVKITASNQRGLVIEQFSISRDIGKSMNSLFDDLVDLGVIRERTEEPVSAIDDSGTHSKKIYITLKSETDYKKLFKAIKNNIP